MQMKSMFATVVLVLAAVSSQESAAQISDAELVELGQAYAEAINQYDSVALDALVSDRHLAQKIGEIAGDSPSEEQEFARQFEQTIPTINRRMMMELERQMTTAIFLRVHEFNGMRGPLVRFTVGDGYNYVLILPVRASRTSGGAQIGDLYYATTGELVSETIGIATKLASAPSETFLGKMFGMTEANTEILSAFQQVGVLRQQNRLREAYDVLDQLQGEIRNHRLILTNTIQIAAQLDDTLYRAELERLARHHKDDPRVAFTLLDYYFFENDLDSAMSTINLMEQSYGSDAVMFILRANVEAARGRNDAALDYARTAVEMEPDSEDATWTLLSLLVQLGNYSEAAEMASLLETKFGYRFTRQDFEADPMYADFARSAEFGRWMDASGR